MNLQTANMILGISKAGSHKPTCWIDQTHITEAAKDGVPLKVIQRRRVTEGKGTPAEVSHVACEISTKGNDELITQAKEVLAAAAKAEQDALMPKEETAGAPAS